MVVKVEICVDSIESLIAAYNGGADRIELCSALEVGGLTPSVGLLQLSKEMFPNLPIYVMVRPRAGDFLYSDNEINLMKHEIEIMTKYGADGFVFGLITPEGELDKDNCKTLLRIAAPLKVTFHRAFDVTKDPLQSLNDLIELGFERVLTSGQAASAIQGVRVIQQLVKQASNQIIIMPGAGVSVENLEEIIRETNATEIHASASSAFGSKMLFKKSTVSMGAASVSEYNWKVCDQEKVKKMKGITNY